MFKLDVVEGSFNEYYTIQLDEFTRPNQTKNSPVSTNQLINHSMHDFRNGLSTTKYC